MTAAKVAEALGNARPDGEDWRCDCPLCHKTNLTLRTGKKRLLVKCWTGCRSRDVFGELRLRNLFLGAKAGNGASETRTEHEARTAAEAAKRKTRIDRALDVWRNSYPAANTIVETYLWSRLLMGPVSPALRFVPSLWHKEASMRYPAMVGLIEHAEKGSVGIHLTYLNPLDATVRVTITPRKRSLGTIKGGAIRLAPAGETLAIAEGIEDALTYMQATGIPAWAAISESGIRNLISPPLGTTSKLVRIEDNDEAGKKAVADAARRFAKHGYAISIARPIGAKDINEALLTLGLHQPLFTIEDYEPHGATGDWYSKCLAGSDGRTLSNLSNALLALGQDRAWKDAFICNGMFDAAMLTRRTPPRANGG
jgi:putative DNA primase/helicase